MTKQLLTLVAAAALLFTGLFAILTAPTTAAEMIGDLDGNGMLTMRDALLLYRVAGGTMPRDDVQDSIADYDGNGVVNLRDALGLYQEVSGGHETPTTTTTVMTTTTTVSTTTTFVKKTTTTVTKATTTTRTKATTTTTTTTNAIGEVYRLVNKERAAVGLPALTYSTAYQTAADVRAKEISVSFSHIRPDGRRCFTVFGDYGYSWGSAVAENIAMGYDTPASVVNGWMNSPDHRKNILSATYTHIIVGYDPSTKAWVQLFYKP